MKRTQSLLAVALVLMGDPDGQHWGYDLSRRAGIRSGVLYPILRRMELEGWVVAGWEDPETVNGRPPRRYYQLTQEGCSALGGMAEDLRRAERRVAARGKLAFDG